MVTAIVKSGSSLGFQQRAQAWAEANPTRASTIPAYIPSSYRPSTTVSQPTYIPSTSVSQPTVVPIKTPSAYYQSSKTGATYTSEAAAQKAGGTVFQVTQAQRYGDVTPISKVQTGTVSTPLLGGQKMPSMERPIDTTISMEALGPPKSSENVLANILAPRNLMGDILGKEPSRVGPTVEKAKEEEIKAKIYRISKTSTTPTTSIVSKTPTTSINLKKMFIPKELVPISITGTKLPSMAVTTDFSNIRGEKAVTSSDYISRYSGDILFGARPDITYIKTGTKSETEINDAVQAVIDLNKEIATLNVASKWIRHPTKLNEERTKRDALITILNKEFPGSNPERFLAKVGIIQEKGLSDKEELKRQLLLQPYILKSDIDNQIKAQNEALKSFSLTTTNLNKKIENFKPILQIHNEQQNVINEQSIQFSKELDLYNKNLNIFDEKAAIFNKNPTNEKTYNELLAMQQNLNSKNAYLTVMGKAIVDKNSELNTIDFHNKLSSINAHIAQSKRVGDKLKVEGEKLDYEKIYEVTTPQDVLDWETKQLRPDTLYKSAVLSNQANQLQKNFNKKYGYLVNTSKNLEAKADLEKIQAIRDEASKLRRPETFGAIQTYKQAEKSFVEQGSIGNRLAVEFASIGATGTAYKESVYEPFSKFLDIKVLEPKLTSEKNFFDVITSDVEQLGVGLVKGAIRNPVQTILTYGITSEIPVIGAAIIKKAGPTVGPVVSNILRLAGVGTLGYFGTKSAEKIILSERPFVTMGEEAIPWIAAGLGIRKGMADIRKATMPDIKSIRPYSSTKSFLDSEKNINFVEKGTFKIKGDRFRYDIRVKGGEDTGVGDYILRIKDLSGKYISEQTGGIKDLYSFIRGSETLPETFLFRSGFKSKPSGFTFEKVKSDIGGKIKLTPLSKESFGTGRPLLSNFLKMYGTEIVGGGTPYTEVGVSKGTIKTQGPVAIEDTSMSSSVKRLTSKTKPMVPIIRSTRGTIPSTILGVNIPMPTIGKMAPVTEILPSKGRLIDFEPLILESLGRYLGGSYFGKSLIGPAYAPKIPVLISGLTLSSPKTSLISGVESIYPTSVSSLIPIEKESFLTGISGVGTLSGLKTYIIPDTISGIREVSDIGEQAGTISISDIITVPEIITPSEPVLPISPIPPFPIGGISAIMGGSGFLASQKRGYKPKKSKYGWIVTNPIAEYGKDMFDKDLGAYMGMGTSKTELFGLSKTKSLMFASVKSQSLKSKIANILK